MCDDYTDLRYRISSCGANVKNEDDDLGNIENEAELEDEDDIDEVVIEQSDGDVSLMEEKLMFIYQSPNMKRLYNRYAHHAIFLDATYRTTKYALPLFFLVVKTNVNYQVSFSLCTDVFVCFGIVAA